MFYYIKTTKKNGFYSIKSPSFSNIQGTGNNFDEALIDFWDKLYKEINMIFQNYSNIPVYTEGKPNCDNKRSHDGVIQITPNVLLKIKLYELLKENGIRPNELTDKITSNVNKLLDSRHHSTVWEFEEAFLELGYNLNVSVKPR